MRGHAKAEVALRDLLPQSARVFGWPSSRFPNEHMAWPKSLRARSARPCPRQLSAFTPSAARHKIYGPAACRPGPKLRLPYSQRREELLITAQRAAFGARHPEPSKAVNARNGHYLGARDLMATRWPACTAVCQGGCRWPDPAPQVHAMSAGRPENRRRGWLAGRAGAGLRWGPGRVDGAWYP
jgi:hypothetical protein